MSLRHAGLVAVGFAAVLALVVHLARGATEESPLSPPLPLPEAIAPTPSPPDPPPREPPPACSPGVVISDEAVDLVAEIEGRVREVVVYPGHRVERGALLARLDTADLRHEIAIEGAGLAVAEGEVRRLALALEQAERVLDRRIALGELFSREDTETSRTGRDTARLELRVAESRLDQVKARIARLEDRLRQGEIRAPFSGTVARRYLEPGALAHRGAPVVRLLGEAGVRIRFAVPPEDAAWLAAGAAVRVEVEGLETPLPGRVVHHSPEIDTPSHRIFAEAVLETGSAAPPPPGMVARVRPAGPGDPGGRCPPFEG